jgi:hypothetical protein
MRLESVIAGGVVSADQVHFEMDVVETLIPEMERLGVAAGAASDLHLLAERVLDTVISTGSVIVGRSEIGAWSRV